MARIHHPSDTQPGPLPEIRADAHSITFVMAPAGTPRNEQLVIRCDDRDQLWIAIRNLGIRN
jgi:hypothetical protein